LRQCSLFISSKLIFVSKRNEDVIFFNFQIKMWNLLSFALFESSIFCFVVQLVSASSDFNVETGFSDCPCTHPLDCATLPAYGENPLDILLFGTHQPCPKWGEIRCCPRKNNPALASWFQC
jgi:hypothetical protein